MLITALQSECSPFSPLALHPPFGAVIAESVGGATRRGDALEGSTWTKKNMRGCALVGFHNAELSDCLPAGFCWMLRSINKLNSELHLSLFHATHANRTHNQQAFPTFDNNRIQDHHQHTWLPPFKRQFYTHSSKPPQILQLLSLWILQIHQTIPVVLFIAYFVGSTHTCFLWVSAQA